LPISRACTFRALRLQHKLGRVQARAKPFSRPTAPVVTAIQERATGRQRGRSLQRRQAFTLRNLRKNGPGTLWKMACRERRCHRGGANSTRRNGVPWSNLCALYMVRRRRTPHNDQSNCDRDFRPHVHPASGLVAKASVPRFDRGAKILHALPGTPLRRSTKGSRNRERTRERF